LGGIAMARKPQQQQHWQKNIERLQLELILITTPQNFYCFTENKQESELYTDSSQQEEQLDTSLSP
jgi:hypothetical protein